MNSLLDTSVIVSALDQADPEHAASRRLILKDKNMGIWSHALSETFSTLTGGRLGYRVAASEAAKILRNFITPRLTIVTLTYKDLLGAYAEAEERGIRGGAIYDYLHLVAARKSGAEKLHTLNSSDFKAFHRAGDPSIHRP